MSARSLVRPVPVEQRRLLVPKTLHGLLVVFGATAQRLGIGFEFGHGARVEFERLIHDGLGHADGGGGGVAESGRQRLRIGLQGGAVYGNLVDDAQLLGFLCLDGAGGEHPGPAG